MKTFINISLTFVFLPCILAGCANAQKVDLATNEAVIAELQKRVDAKRSELGKTGGSKLSAKSVCIERLKESEKVIVIGFFAYDRGCRLDGAFVDTRYFESTDAALSKNALAAFGWEKAPKREREMLALYWVEKGMLAFFTILYTKDKDMGEREFHPPQAMTAENGEIKVKLWVQLPSGMRRGKEFKRVEYRFSKDGNLVVSHDKDREWTISVQGGYHVENFSAPAFGKQWIDYFGRSYGYGCACFQMTVDKETSRVLAIRKSYVKPLSVCRKDKALRKWKSELE